MDRQNDRSKRFSGITSDKTMIITVIRLSKYLIHTIHLISCFSDYTPTMRYRLVCNWSCMQRSRQTFNLSSLTIGILWVYFFLKYSGFRYNRIISTVLNRFTTSFYIEFTSLPVDIIKHEIACHLEMCKTRN